LEIIIQKAGISKVIRYVNDEDWIEDWIKDNTKKLEKGEENISMKVERA
jgi:hypothetical protein